MAVKKSNFDINKYQIQNTLQKIKVEIPDTGDAFEVSVKQLSWSQRNQLVSKCLEWQKDGQTNFNGDLYVKESLKEMIVEAPWGRTTESFLSSIDARLGAALESLVPKAYGDEDGIDPTNVKKG